MKPCREEAGQSGKKDPGAGKGAPGLQGDRRIVERADETHTSGPAWLQHDSGRIRTSLGLPSGSASWRSTPAFTPPVHQ